MYKAVEQVCNTHAELLSGLSVIREIVAELTANLSKIGIVAARQGTNIQGFTADKQSFRERIAEMALQIGGAVSAYAVKNKNNHLKQTVAYTASQFKRGADQDVVNFAQIIHDQAKVNQEALRPYGITSVLLDQLQADIQNYGNLIGARRQILGGQVAATQDLDTLFTETDVLLREVLDGLVLSFRKSESSFFKSYTNARIVIGQSKRTKPEVAVLEQ